MSIALDADTDTYVSIEQMLHKLCHQFIARYGGEFEELRANANLLYQRSYITYSQEHGSKFSSWAWFKVWNGLLDITRRELHRAHLLPRGSDDFDLHEWQDRANFDLPQFAGELSNDAQIAIMLLCDYLDCVYEWSERRRPTNGDLIGEAVKNPAGLRKGLRMFLKNLGWTSQRVKDTFAEISEALPF